MNYQHNQLPSLPKCIGVDRSKQGGVWCDMVWYGVHCLDVCRFRIGMRMGMKRIVS